MTLNETPLSIASNALADTARLHRTWLKGAAIASLGFALSACDMMVEAPEESAGPSTGREAVVTSSFEVTAPLGGLVFLPNADAPWTGRIASTLTGGGFDIFNVEGERILSASGPRLDGLTGAPAFPLRGETFPILFGIDSDRALRGFVVAEQASTVIEIPLEMGLEGQWASTCLYDTGIGFVDVALLGEGSNAAIVRVQDGGGDGLTVTEQARFDLPYPTRDCAAANGDLVLSAPTGGLLRVSPTGVVEAQTRSLSVFDVAYSELFGQAVVLTTESGTPTIAVYDLETLEPIATVTTTDGLSTQGFQRPSHLAATLESYGGISFATGLIGGYDREDGTVKLLARDVVSRAVFASDDSTG